MKAFSIVLAGFASVTVAQQQTLCDLYAYYSTNGYELLNNLWGRDAATSGSQCTYYDGFNNGMAWHSNWQWQGAENNVKSYVYAGRLATKKLISQYSTMPSTAQWSYNTTNVRANVAYDVFTAADINHDRSSGDYELMVWLARLGNVYPIGTSQGMKTVDGRSWELWEGYNGAMKVYSFVAPSPVTNYSGDIKNFFTWLTSNKGYPASSQNLIGKFLMVL
jgi:xyloglucan-specific endo-beta-1,4-glucanase